jgi:hypothetical protein
MDQGFAMLNFARPRTSLDAVFLVISAVVVRAQSATTAPVTNVGRQPGSRLTITYPLSGTDDLAAWNEPRQSSSISDNISP